MGLSTKNVDENVGTGSGVSKTITPGPILATLHKVELSNFSPLAKEKNGYNVILHLEGPAMGENFEGFFIDKDDESKGRYVGQVGFVKTHSWPYADGTTKTGKPVNRDMDIMRDLKRICISAGCLDWFEGEDGKHETIESLVEAFNSNCPIIGKKMNFCIGGRQYMSGDGYKKWDLVLPGWSEKAWPYEPEGVEAEKSKLITFDENEHVEFYQEETVDDFAGDAAPEGAVEDEFDLGDEL